MEALREMGLSYGGRWPGAHAMHIERHQLPLLGKGGYVVADKSDGTRALMVFRRRGSILLVDRGFRETPLRAESGTPADHAVLDGEVVVARFNERLFMVYDALVASGRDVTRLGLQERLAAAADFLSAFPGGKLLFAEPSPSATTLRAIVKAVAPASMIREYTRDVIATLPYATDGLVFTPASDPVSPGTSSTLLKWKPAENVTVDFEVAQEVGYRFGLHLRDRSGRRVRVAAETWRGVDAMIATIALEDSGAEDPYAVVECCAVRARDGGREVSWRPLKHRRDKSKGNSVFVYENTLKNMNENITLEEIIAACTAGTAGTPDMSSG